jgi:hypothetical protein
MSELSDPVLISAISGGLTLASTVFTALMVYLMAKLNTKADAAKLVGDATHVLVNSNMAAQLKLTAIALRRVALLTKEPEDLAAAKQADTLLREHENRSET